MLIIFSSLNTLLVVRYFIYLHCILTTFISMFVLTFVSILTSFESPSLPFSLCLPDMPHQISVLVSVLVSDLA